MGVFFIIVGRVFGIFGVIIKKEWLCHFVAVLDAEFADNVIDFVQTDTIDIQKRLQFVAIVCTSFFGSQGFGDFPII